MGHPVLLCVFALTVDEDVGGGLELPALPEGPVPDGAAVGGAVVLLGRHDREDRPGGGRGKLQDVSLFLCK